MPWRSWGAGVAARTPEQPGPSSGSLPEGRGSQTALQALLLAGVAVAVHANALPNALVLDAETLIAKNPLVRDLSQLHVLLRSDYWRPELVSGLYRPCVTFSWALQHALGGSAAAVHNAINVLLHAGVCLVAWRLYARLASPGVALGGALLFATLAVHSEVVANAVGRAELLAALLALASFLAYLRLRERPSVSWMPAAACLAAYALAILSKENAVVLLAVIPLYEGLYGPGEAVVGRLRAAWARTGPIVVGLAVTAAACLVLRLWALGDDPVPPSNPIDNPLLRLDTADRVLTALRVVLIYAKLLVWPAHLSYDYSYDAIPLLSVADPAAWLSAAAVLGLALAGWWSRRVDRAIAFGLGFAALALLPVSNLLLPVGTILGERLLYLPSIGFCLALVAALEAACARLGSPRAARATLIAVVAILVCGHGARTWLRNPDWRTETRLALHDVEIVPGSAKAQANAGKALQNLGRHQEAIGRFERALAIAPGLSAAYTNWSFSLSALGRHREAAEILERQLRRGQADPVLYNNLGFLLVDHELDVPRGVVLLERAVAERPHDPEMLDSLGWGYYKLGRLEDARAALRRSLELAPGGPTRSVREEHLRVVEEALRSAGGRGSAP